MEILRKGTMCILSSPEFRTALKNDDQGAIAALNAKIQSTLMDFAGSFGLHGRIEMDSEVADMLFDFILDQTREPGAGAGTKAMTKQTDVHGRPENYADTHYRDANQRKEREKTA